MQNSNPLFDTDNIEVHIRTYRSLLKSAGELKISQLVDSHIKMNPLLHEKAGGEKIDIASFIYVLLRLPFIMSNVKTIILGQSYDVFKKHSLAKIVSWKEVSSAGRRRKMYYNNTDTLAVYIASVSDVDDIISLLTAFQIEWNKFHRALANQTDLEKALRKCVNTNDLEKIKKIWGKNFLKFLSAIKKRAVDFKVRLLSGSYIEYAKATQKWWENIEKKLKTLGLSNKPIYFVSSNTHSIVNLLTGFAKKNEKILINYLFQEKNKQLVNLWKKIKTGQMQNSEENFLYYLAKKYSQKNPDYLRKKSFWEKSLGIHTIKAFHYLDIDCQIIELKKLRSSALDPRLPISQKQLQKSGAIIINIDYPLGWAAYQILTEIGQNVSSVEGIYIMGKAATLNGQIGDILIPESVFDEHTKNTYVFDNCFKPSDFQPFFNTGMVLNRQKTICVKGTFFENRQLIKQWYKAGYTIIEMETGPYLNAIYEFVYYNRYMENQFINLTQTPFEIGIAHYASDTPYSKAKNLGVRNLSFEGVEPTYAVSLAILKKIFQREM